MFGDVGMLRVSVFCMHSSGPSKTSENRKTCETGKLEMTELLNPVKKISK